MCNHFRVLLEVPPMAKEGTSDGELLKRLGALWEQRFKSVMVEDGVAARTMAA